jgi:uncharacterized phage protein (predicted DNA packaging)
MAVALTELKAFLKADYDEDTEEDALIESLGAAAVSYLEQTTGKAFNDSDLFCLAEKQLVLHWYENRTAFSTKTNLHELPHSLQAIITHISLASAYDGLEAAP